MCHILYTIWRTPTSSQAPMHLVGLPSLNRITPPPYRGLLVIPKGHFSENTMTVIIPKGHYSENNIRVIIPKIT